MSKEVLIIDSGLVAGHSHGELNHHYAKMAYDFLTANGYNVTITKMADDFEVEAEVAKLERADYIIFQTPGYWMSIPWQLKRYIDLCFGNPKLCGGDGRSREDASKRYGSGGFLKSKHYMISTTWNAPLEAFTDKDQFFGGIGIDGVFLPLHKTMEFLGVNKLPTFMANDVIKNPTHEADFARFNEHLKSIFVK